MNKKIAALLAVTALVVGSATIVFANTNPGTGVNGSVHDMNTKYPGNPDAMGRVCVFCHTPHNADSSEAAGSYPLWNHTLPPANGWASYAWATPLNSSLDQDPMAGPSRLCMSCHDGVIAPDQHNGSNGGNAPQAGTGPLTGFKAIGLLGGQAGTTMNLTDDHPIGFSYTDAVDKRNTTAGNASDTVEVAPIAWRFVTAVGAGNVNETYPVHTRNGKRAIADVLYGGSIMTCASCHEVHNKDNVAPSVNNAPGPAQNNYLLWADENQSMICLSCHLK